MLTATNCPRCGRVFTKIRNNVCPACEKIEEETFNVLKAYIEENPLCNMGQLSEATKVPIKRITQYIRDGRLEISQGMQGEIACSTCGKPIKTGRYCEACAIEIGKNVNEMFGKYGEGEGGKGKNRMFTLGQQKKL